MKRDKLTSLHQRRRFLMLILRPTTTTTKYSIRPLKRILFVVFTFAPSKQFIDKKKKKWYQIYDVYTEFEPASHNEWKWIGMWHLRNMAKLHRDRVYGRSTYFGKRLIANEAQTKGNYVLLVGYARIKPFEAPLPFFVVVVVFHFLMRTRGLFIRQHKTFSQKY